MIKKVLLVAVLIIAASFLNEVLPAGMGMGPPSPPCGTPPFPPCAVPLDGGIGLLAGLGILYGSRKLMQHKKSK